jgi:Ring finger domain
MNSHRNDFFQLLLTDLLLNLTEGNNPFYDTTFTSSQSILNQSLYDTNPIKHVITDAVKNDLTVIKYKDAVEKEKNDKCSITMEPFNNNDDIIQLPCNHCFFVDPIMHWLTEENCECPICRYKFDSIEKNTRVVEEEQPFRHEIIGVENIPEPPELIPINSALFSQIMENILLEDIANDFDFDLPNNNNSDNFDLD